jgi:hypothetical protein
LQKIFEIITAASKARQASCASDYKNRWFLPSEA